jgi:hypothetical protein
MFQALTRNNLIRRAAWLALFALLLQTLVPLVHQPAAMASAAGQVIRICSSLARGAGESSDADKSATHKLPSCPVCQSLKLLAGGFVTPVPVAFFADAERLADYAPHHAAITITPWRISVAQPRAPPTLV